MIDRLTADDLTRMRAEHVHWDGKIEGPVVVKTPWPQTPKELASMPFHCSTPRQRVPQRTPLMVRFWSKVARTDTCWLWTASVTTNGYGHLTSGGDRGRTLLAHKVAWEDVAGPVPDGLFVCHVCDVHPCVRNDDEGVYVVAGIEYPRRGHLWIGDQVANMADMKAKGRASVGEIHSMLMRAISPRGEKNSQARLTTCDVSDIRTAYARGGVSQRQLAGQFGVNQKTVSLIIQRKTWAE